MFISRVASGFEVHVSRLCFEGWDITGAEGVCIGVTDLGLLGVQTPASGVRDQEAGAAAKTAFNSEPVFRAPCG